MCSPYLLFSFVPALRNADFFKHGGHLAYAEACFSPNAYVPAHIPGRSDRHAIRNQEMDWFKSLTNTNIKQQLRK